jgi:hypothetical protein
MNKDLDERLVPEGDYRDATNIEVTTSEGSNAGVAQTLRGNIKINNIAAPTFSDLQQDQVGGIPDAGGGVCVGSITAPDKDKIYYFVNSSSHSTSGTKLPTRKDYIIEYDDATKKQRFVFVDIYNVDTAVVGDVASSFTFHVSANASDAVNKSGIRLGMVMSTLDYTETESNVKVTDISYDTDVSKWKITVDTAVTLSTADNVYFRSDRVLWFDRSNIITGINILDDFLFWTDNKSEPKKINIPRSIRGTGGNEYLSGAGNSGISGALNNASTAVFEGDTAYFHTRLVIDSPASDFVNYKVVTNEAGNKAVYVTEENVAVIRKAPVTTLDLDMYRTSLGRLNPVTGIENETSGSTTNGTAVFTTEGEVLVAGQVVPGVIFDEPVDFRVNDILLFRHLNEVPVDGTYNENTRDVRVKVVSGPEGWPSVISEGPYNLEVRSVKSDVTVSDISWKVDLEKKDTLFNFKFPRFSYRYKYSDGEYSTFAPWSQVAFLPDNFDYQPKKGHNLGMMNKLRGLKIKGYHPHEDAMPQDVVAVDILYKESGKPPVYIVKTITPRDLHPLWPDNTIAPYNARGEFELTTDMIYSVIPSNQLLRPWDNVPRKALAQEISANRLIYGNYVQNYSIGFSPVMNLSMDSLTVEDRPESSVKTMRDYQVGVVFSDKYGRETPVVTSKNSSIRVPKNLSALKNRLKVSLDPVMDIPTWAEYYSFYVKETSVEYYTLSMDRWYNAADGNIWLSFSSSERNKLKEEDFLILKKSHGSDGVVHEEAKYRVLAIESEAPDFIKTRKVSLGNVSNSEENGQFDIGNSGLGYPLPNTRAVYIQKPAFEAAFGNQMHIDTPKRLFLRVTLGGESTSNYYRVTQVASSDQDDIVKLTSSKNFGADMSFTSSDESYATAVQGVKLELVEERVENHPEFDGRFFVKIFKDDVLDQYVTESSEEEWYTSQAWPLGYINNNGYVNAGTRLSPAADNSLLGKPPGIAGTIPKRPVYAMRSHKIWAQLPADQAPLGVQEPTDGYLHHYSSWKYTHGPLHPTEYDWSGLAGYNSSSDSNGAQYEWHSGVIEGAYNAEQTANMANCVIRGINGAMIAEGFEFIHSSLPSDLRPVGWSGTPNVDWNTKDGSEAWEVWGKNAQIYWHGVNNRNRFFIDGATAYQLTEGKRDLPGNRFTSLNITGNSGFANSFNLQDDWGGTTEYLNGGVVTTGNYLPKANSKGYHGTMVPPGNWFGPGWGYGDTTGTLPDGADPYGGPYSISPGPNFTAKPTNNFHTHGPYAGQMPELCIEANANGGDPRAANMKQNWSYFGTTAPGDDDASVAISTNGTGNHFVPWGNNEAYYNHQSGGGTPSRGIWDCGEYSAMDISWSSFKDGGDQWNVNDDTPRAHTLANATSVVDSDAWVFMEEFVTPGTKFRFKNDPDSQIYTIYPYVSPYVSEGYDNSYLYHAGTSIYTGAWGIRNMGYGSSHYWDDNDEYGDPPTPTGVNTPVVRNLFAQYNRRQRWTVLIKPKIGSGEHGYNPIHGTDPSTMDPSGVLDPNWRRALRHDGGGSGDAIEIISPFSSEETVYSENPAIWETEPREAAELDIYYQASRLIPLRLNRKTIEEYIPVGSTFRTFGYYGAGIGGTGGGPEVADVTSISVTHVVVGHADDNTLKFSNALPQLEGVAGAVGDGSLIFEEGSTLEFTLPDGGTSTIVLSSDAVVGAYKLSFRGGVSTTSSSSKLFSQKHKLSWSNCWSFGNGVESDRIRDDFNAPQLDNGVKVSATLGDQRIKEEHRKYGLIWSGLYNSNSGVNDTNQFVMAEAITKDINPSHGSIQALKTGDTLLRIFCEDKVLKAVTNKDLLFNADGSSNLIASTKVIGAVSAYQGDFGISTNPESLVKTPYNHYFVDANRGKVLALSTEGVRPISELGMKDYFADTLRGYVGKIIGSYDSKKSEYNVSINKAFNTDQTLSNSQATVSYNEGSKGWSSFKTFYKTHNTEPGEVQGLEQGVSLNNKYFTFLDGHLWEHHTDEVARSNFYGQQFLSDITVIFNDMSESVKSFNTINYEGSQARVTNWNDTTSGVDAVGFYNNNSSSGSGATVGTTAVDNVKDGEYYNLGAVAGWYAESVITDLQSCGELDFKDKEGKWYGYPSGDSTALANLDEKEFSVQGLGVATMTHSAPTDGEPIEIKIANNTSTTYETDGGAGGTDWDITAD